MVIADTGPLYALIDRSDAWHERVTAWWTAQARHIRVPITVLPEVCYLLQTRISAQAEQAFVRSVANGELIIEPVESHDVIRASVLMREYLDFPLGFVDATVIAVAERLGAREILTTDRRHFTAVRTNGSRLVSLVP
jgi:predicted nucleic acid-binding protein